MLMTCFCLKDIGVFARREITLMSPIGYQRYRSSSGVSSLRKFVFVCRILCDGSAKKSLGAMHHLFRSWTPGKLSIWLQATEARDSFFFLHSEISKPRRHSINYSPSLRQSDILIMTRGGCMASVSLQSRHDRSLNSNMFAAKNYGPLWCVNHLQGIRMNGNNSFSAYFMSHSPTKEITTLVIVWMMTMMVIFVLNRR